MFAFVARQPILNSEKEVFAYELLFRDGKNNCYPVEQDSPELAARKAKDSLKLGLDDISCQKTSFINFNRETLVNGLPASLDPSNVVVEIDNEASSNHELVDTCKNIKNMGFKIALDDPRLGREGSELLPYVDIVKVDVTAHEYESIERDLPRLLDANVKLVAEKVESQKDFATCRDMGFDYFQGYFFSKPESFTQKQLPMSKISLVELIAESSKSTFEIDKINQIMERDVGLSYMLLRFINNPMVNKRQKITSLRHALTYLGEVEIKKFIALLALANLADNKPMELLHLSLVRARFCDLLSQEKHLGDNPPTGFMVGLFSLLDALLDQKMQDALSQIPVLDEVKFALCGGQNDFYLYLALVRAFESATWLKVKRISDMLQVDQRRLHAIFNEAILWGNSVRQTVSPHFPKPMISRP